MVKEKENSGSDAIIYILILISIVLSIVAIITDDTGKDYDDSDLYSKYNTVSNALDDEIAARWSEDTLNRKIEIEVKKQYDDALNDVADNIENQFEDYFDAIDDIENDVDDILDCVDEEDNYSDFQDCL